MKGLILKMKNNQRGITLIALVITIIVLLILAGVSIAILTGDNGILRQANRAKDKYSASEVREKLELAISEAKTDQYINNGRIVDYDNIIGYNGILQEKIPEIENWVASDILLCYDYYFQVMTDLKIKQVDFKINYKSVQEMKNDGANLKENDIVSTLAYYEGSSKSGGGVYKITSNIDNLIEDEGRVIKIDNTNLYAVLEINNNSLNVMQYGTYGDGKEDDTIRLQKVFDMIYKNGGGTVYFPSGTYITRIQENTGYSSAKACLTILGGNINLIGTGSSEIKQVGYNYGDLADDYFYDESKGKYYRGHMLMFGSDKEPVNNNIKIKGLVLNGGASTMPSYEESGSWDGTSPCQWDITHKGIFLYNGNSAANSNNVDIDNCVFKNFRGEAYYGGSYLSDNSEIVNTLFENCVTGISAEGFTEIENCRFKGITFNSFEAYVVRNLIFKNCKFENCNRGLEILNNDKWEIGVQCDITNCEFNNLNCAIRVYGGGIRNIYNNKFTDCGNSFYVMNGNTNSRYNYYNNENILDKQSKGSGIYISGLYDTSIYNNTFKRSDNAKQNNFKCNSAINLVYYGAISSIEETVENCKIYNNYVEPGYCVYGESEIDKDILWNPSLKCNVIASSGGVCVGYGNPFDTSSPYNNGVYRPTKIQIKGEVNEDCNVIIKIEYYVLNGNKNETIEETIYTESKNVGEEFSAVFDKKIITDARKIYPKIKIYNSKNSSTAINATFTLNQY